MFTDKKYYDFQDRARIQTKRRPPTRQARRAAAEASQSDDLFGDATPTAASRVSMDTTDSKAPSFATSSSVPSGVKPKKQDLFGNDDLFNENINISSKSSGAIPKSSSKVEKPLTAASDSADNKTDKVAAKEESKKDHLTIPSKKEDDLFSSNKIGSTKTESKSVKKHKSPDIDDDIFSSATKSALKKPGKVDDDDDLFTSSSKPPKQVSAVPMFEPPPLDDDDDIFSSGTKQKKSAIAQVLDDDDDDDIFARSSVAKGISSVSKAAAEIKTPAAASGIPDDDDIFADASINKPKGNT